MTPHSSSSARSARVPVSYLGTPSVARHAATFPIGPRRVISSFETGSSNSIMKRKNSLVIQGSAGPPGPARIATTSRSSGSAEPGRQRRPSRAGEDRNGAAHWNPGGDEPAAPALPGRRGSQHQQPLDDPVRPLLQRRPSRAGEDRNLTATDSGVASTVGQRRPSRAGEDRNPNAAGTSDRRVRDGSAGPPGPARIATNSSLPVYGSTGTQRRPSRAGEDRNHVISPSTNHASGAAPALPGRRGSQRDPGL